jgi:hypothetical protein
MPVRKTPPHKTLVRNLLASKRLTEGETKAFLRMVETIERGDELTEHQKLWIEILREKYK